MHLNQPGFNHVCLVIGFVCNKKAKKSVKSIKSQFFECGQTSCPDINALGETVMLPERSPISFLNSFYPFFLSSQKPPPENFLYIHLYSVALSTLCQQLCQIFKYIFAYYLSFFCILFISSLLKNLMRLTVRQQKKAFFPLGGHSIKKQLLAALLFTRSYHSAEWHV